MRLNRELQLTLLTAICNAYPNELNSSQNTDALDFRCEEVAKNLVYLEQHGLLELKATKYQGGEFTIHWATATHKGMDFMEADGGLSAILNTMVVKLHPDTVQELLSAKVMASDLPQSEKLKLLDALKKIPARALERLTDEALDRAINLAPDAIQWISKVLEGPLK